MNRIIRALVLILFCLPACCLATKACNPLSKSEFLSEVAHQSDLSHWLAFRKRVLPIT